MEPNFDYNFHLNNELIQCQIDQLSSPKWSYNSYSTPSYLEWNQPWGSCYEEQQYQDPPPPPYWDEEPPTEWWSHTQQELLALHQQQPELTMPRIKGVQELADELLEARWQLHVAMQECRLGDLQRLVNRVMDLEKEMQAFQAQQSESQQSPMMMVPDEVEDEVVHAPSVGEVVKDSGEMDSDEVEHAEQQEEVPYTNPTPWPPMVEESTPQPDGTNYFGVIDPFEQFIEDKFAEIGMLVAIRQELGLEELTRLKEDMVLMMKLRKPLLGQMHELVTPHGLLDLQRVGVG